MHQLSPWNLEGLRPCPWHTSTAAPEPRWTVEITLEPSCPIHLHFLCLVIASTDVQLPQNFNSHALLYTSTRNFPLRIIQGMAVLSKPVREASPGRDDAPAHQDKPVRKKRRGRKAKSGQKKKPAREDSPEQEDSPVEEYLPVQEDESTQMSTGIYKVSQPTRTKPSLPLYWIEEYLDHCLKFENMTPTEADSFRDMFQKTDCTDKHQMNFLNELLRYREKNLALTWVTENIAQDRAPISPLLLSFVPVTQSPD